MAATHQDVHALAHTVRMGLVLAANPDHARRDEYALAIADYAHRWARLSAEDRAEAVETVSQIAGMTDGVIAAAVAALEA